jgi:hypothetical protein
MRQRRGNMHRQYHYRNNNPDGQNHLGQFLPLLFILIVMIFANFMNNFQMGPSYSFKQTATYSYQLETGTHHVKYFVDRDTYDLIRESRSATANLESTIENDYYRMHSRSWRQSKDVYSHWVRQARYYTQGTAKYQDNMDKANNVDMTSWSIVNEMNERHE